MRNETPWECDGGHLYWILEHNSTAKPATARAHTVRPGDVIFTGPIKVIWVDTSGAVFQTAGASRLYPGVLPASVPVFTRFRPDSDCQKGIEDPARYWQSAHDHGRHRQHAFSAVEEGRIP